MTEDGPGTPPNDAVAVALSSSDTAYGTCGDDWFAGRDDPASTWPTCLFLGRPEDV